MRLFPFLLFQRISRAGARRPNIRLTCNLSLAWFVRQYLSTNHDKPD